MGLTFSNPLHLGMTESSSGFNVSVTPLNGIDVKGSDIKNKSIYYVIGGIMALAVVFLGLWALSVLPAIFLGLVGLSCVVFILDPYFENINFNVGDISSNPNNQAIAGLLLLGVAYAFNTYSNLLVIQPVVDFTNAYQLQIALAVILWVSITTILSKW